VLAGTGVAQGAPTVDDSAVSATPSIAEQQELHAETRVWEREQPAADLLTKLPLPDGVAPCDPGATVAVSHLICWRGDADQVRTTGAVAKGLRAIGLTDVAPRCAELRGGSRSLTLCEVRATVLGQPLVVHVGTRFDGTDPRAKPSGVSVFGGLGSLARIATPRIPSRATPVPVPAR
jgi:hypothetical protein